MGLRYSTCLDPNNIEGDLNERYIHKTRSLSEKHCLYDENRETSSDGEDDDDDDDDDDEEEEGNDNEDNNLHPHRHRNHDGDDDFYPFDDGFYDEDLNEPINATRIMTETIAQMQQQVNTTRSSRSQGSHPLPTPRLGTFSQLASNNQVHLNRTRSTSRASSDGPASLPYMSFRDSNARYDHIATVRGGPYHRGTLIYHRQYGSRNSASPSESQSAASRLTNPSRGSNLQGTAIQSSQLSSTATTSSPARQQPPSSVATLNKRNKTHPNSFYKTDPKYNDNGKALTYGCATCLTHLSSSNLIISDKYQGVTGDAVLIYNVVNVIVGRWEVRKMTTGSYTVGDIKCHQCFRLVGWKYFKSDRADQKFKEGRFILEMNCVKVVP